MNSRVKEFIKNFSMVIAGNIFSMLIAVTVTFLVPHFFSSEAYSYFQLENLYCGYIWIISLGWNDGLYVKFGGAKRSEIGCGKVSSQFMALVIYLIASGCIIASIFSSRFETSEKRFVFYMALISVTVEIVTCSVTNLLQATNSMKQYAKITILDRGYYFCFVVMLLFLDIRDFYHLIAVDIISKCITLFIVLYSGRDFVFGKPQDIKQVLADIKDILSIGINISMASYASRMINNIVQLVIENMWGLLIFGKVALTLSISNMFTKFVSAVSVVIFPVLRRAEGKSRENAYYVLNTFLMTVMLGIFCFYLPARKLLELWLPEYKESLHYMAILLPISLFETKTVMLVNTYLKIMRKEKEILYCNLITVLLSIVLSFMGAVLFHNLIMTVSMIVVLLAFRCMLEEYRLSKYISIPKNNCSEIIMCLTFIATSWGLKNFVGMLLYLCVYAVYLYLSRDRIKDLYFYLKSLCGK